MRLDKFEFLLIALLGLMAWWFSTEPSTPSRWTNVPWCEEYLITAKDLGVGIDFRGTNYIDVP